MLTIGSLFSGIGGQTRVSAATLRGVDVKALGNAVVPECAEVAGWVVRALEEGGLA